jgi:hypothetical protein
MSNSIIDLIRFYNNCENIEMKNVIGSISVIYLPDNTMYKFFPNLSSGKYVFEEDVYDYERYRFETITDYFEQSLMCAYKDYIEKNRKNAFNNSMKIYNESNLIEKPSPHIEFCNDELCPCSSIIKKIDESGNFNTRVDPKNILYYEGGYYEDEDEYYEDYEPNNEEEEKRESLDRKNKLLEEYCETVDDNDLICSATQIEFDDNTCIEYHYDETTVFQTSLLTEEDLDIQTRNTSCIRGFNHGVELAETIGEYKGRQDAYLEIIEMEKIRIKELKASEKYHKGNSYHQTFLDDYDQYKNVKTYENDDIYKTISSYYNYTYKNSKPKYEDENKLESLFYEGYFEKNNKNYVGIIPKEIVSGIFCENIGDDNKIGVYVKIMSSLSEIEVEISPNFETKYYKFKYTDLDKLYKKTNVDKIYNLGICRDAASLINSFM